MDHPNGLQRLNVLLVDDDAQLREVLTMGLQAAGFNVVSAGTAEDALRLAGSPDVPIDVIVMDLFLPDAWGGQVAMEQSRFRPEAKVIFISGYAEGDPVLEASAAGKDIRFLPKPFTIDQLGRLIRQVMAEPGSGEAVG